MKREILDFLNFGIGFVKSIEEQIEKSKVELEEIKRRGEVEKTETIQQVEKLLIKFIKDSKKIEENLFKPKQSNTQSENFPGSRKEADSVDSTRNRKTQKSKKFRAA